VGNYVIILAVVFAAMWLLLIRPQRRKQLAQSRMQDAIEVGDEVLTAGGIHGTVREMEDEIVHVEIAPGTTVRLDRRAVAAIAQEPEPGPEPEALAQPEQAASRDES